MKLSDLRPNEGQIEGVPSNPRTITEDDFEKLKKIYKTGKFKSRIDMGDNYTDGFTVSLSKCRKQNILVYEAAYEYDDMIGYYYIKN